MDRELSATTRQAHKQKRLWQIGIAVALVAATIFGFRKLITPSLERSEIRTVVVERGPVQATLAILKNERQAYEKVIRVMSHEVNNTAGAINSILGSLQHYTPQLRPDDRQDFEHVLQVATDRNTSLSRFMANFAEVVRLPQPQKEPTDLHELLHRLHRLLQPELQRRHICLQWQLSPQPLVVPLDAQQIEQVLLNILKNAMEAIGSEGAITIATTLHPPQLTISDSGTGIPADVLPHLFTPFYTTKNNGQGIGLIMVRDILVNHGFDFSLNSSVGLTSFTIRLQPRT